MEFYCTKCGGCCHKTNLQQYNIEHWGLTLGEDDYCTNFKDGTCSIYEDRPLICRVEDAFDKAEELKEIEPQLYNFLERMRCVLSASEDIKLEYFKSANMGCNSLIRRLNLGNEYLIDIKNVYTEVNLKSKMVDKSDKETKKEDRIDKKKSKREYRIERIKAITAKALAVAKKRKWLVFLIGIGLAAYFAISSGKLSGVFDMIKGLLGR
jgi:Fe-S-cluster containining protein